MIPEFPLPDEADLLHSVLRPPIYAQYSPSKLLPPALRPDLSTGTVYIPSLWDTIGYGSELNLIDYIPGWSFFKSIETAPIKIVPSTSSTRKVAPSAAVSMRSFSQCPLSVIASQFIGNSPFRLLAA